MIEEEKKLEYTPTGRVKKRRMLRKPQRLKTEYEERTGRSMKGTIHTLRVSKYRKKRRIKDLRVEKRDLKAENAKKIHRLNVLHRRELRKKDTLYKALKNKLEDFKRRRGQRIITVKYKNKYKTYENPKEVEKFEKACVNLLDKYNNIDNSLSIFETVVKILRFLEEYNEKNNTKLNIHHYLVLVNYQLLSSELTGIQATKITLPFGSPRISRNYTLYLEELGFLKKMSVMKFRINLLGEDFLKQAKNYHLFNKSEIVEAIKNTAGYFK